ncbi:MAG TPA: sigma-54 dependent transcriptional regulator [Candidatus Saccharimonadia bacterium]|nr:sigma-54 dependent transcriptional regulator [Candidatus Saccharimonadia bacterium]
MPLPARALSLLVVDDDSAFLEAVRDYAQLSRFTATTAASLAQARSALRHQRYDLILVDLGLPDGSGFELLDEVDLADRGHFAIVTGHPSVETAVRAVQLPVLDYLVKPLEPARFKELLDRVAANASAPRPGVEAPAGAGEIFGESPALKDILRQIRLVAPTDATVLLAGESGTGKELAARAVHDLSGRSGAFVAVNCGAVTAELLASHLFGHERGSFTGAVKQHIGYFEQAHGGTLFLDEITEMPLALQVHLLRTLESKSITRVGGTREHEIDVRVVAASNRDPQEAITAGALRDDLYYRLVEIPLYLPPLRERGSDVVLLARLFLARLNARYNANRSFSPESEAELKGYDWPGNVRELKHVVQRAFILSEGDAVKIAPLKRRASGPIEHGENTLTFNVGTSFDEMERWMLLKTLAYFNNDKTRTAEALGISLKTIYNRLARYEQHKEASG